MVKFDDVLRACHFGRVHKFVVLKQGVSMSQDGGWGPDKASIGSIRNESGHCAKWKESIGFR